ncbi:hypothetical protein DFJ43DRAFT_1081890 [Lentinula guzmanii]|uniref:Uncharacterized protein n=1 Tax=Lentinula guzmanii TaxID=2804957 RepID=A0AA38MYG8_9AGAR|nr:hypothetical protein DFJ43DRAFT_1081890 [Lentinula guzmanii]
MPSRRKTSQRESPSSSISKKYAAPEETTGKESSTDQPFLPDDLSPDQVEGRLYISQLTCKFLTWYFWPKDTTLSDISTIVLAFISVIRAYFKYPNADEGISSYFLLIEIVTIASSSVNLLLGNIPDVSAGTRAQFFDLLLTLSSFAVFFLLYETLITRCIWSTSKHLLNCDELRGI